VLEDDASVVGVSVELPPEASGVAADVSGSADPSALDVRSVVDVEMLAQPEIATSIDTTSAATAFFLTIAPPCRPLGTKRIRRALVDAVKVIALTKGHLQAPALAPT
jgi:hypothetical protein